MGWRDTAALLRGDIDWPEFQHRNPNDPFTAVAIYVQQRPEIVADFLIKVIKKDVKDSAKEVGQDEDGRALWEGGAGCR